MCATNSGATARSLDNRGYTAHINIHKCVSLVLGAVSQYRKLWILRIQLSKLQRNTGSYTSDGLRNLEQS